ncbi:MAG: phenylalanine--tRNA ligase subunit alpha, partial [Nitrospiraceae bacterium]
MLSDIESIEAGARDEISRAESLRDVQDIRVKYLGRKGVITARLKSLGSVPQEDRPETGRVLNDARNIIETLLKQKEEVLRSSELTRALQTDRIDITVPGCSIPPGHLHPVTQVLNELISIFVSLGFTVEEGPEIELDYYNFEALNFPPDHPARDMQDTFFISDDVVLRTHTSSVQVRVMEKNTPPLRVIAAGKVYRCDADISHIPMFHQLEGFMVDRHIRMTDLKGVLELFIHRVFGPGTSL